MSVSRNLASLGTIVTTTSGLNITLANNITTANATNLNVSGNTSLRYVSANSSYGTAGYVLTTSGSTSNVYWQSIPNILNTTSITLSNTVTFSNAVTFSNTISVANINSTYIANTTFNNYKEQTYTNTTFGYAYTIDLNNGSVHLLTLNNSTTITMPAVSAGKSFTLIINTGTAGNFVVNWSGVTWTDNVAPIVTTTSSKRDIFSFISDGSSWFGFVAGQNF